MRTRNRILALVLALVMAVSCLPMAALAEELESEITEATAATEVPAEEPTEAPAVEPTVEPTEAPTEESAEIPAEDPTETTAVTEAPAEEPTEAPTEESTEEPTETPTEESAETPSEEPAEVPGELAEVEDNAIEQAEPETASMPASYLYNNCIAHGKCGSNLEYWLYTDGQYQPCKLVITGSGAMDDFSSTGNRPWYRSFCGNIVEVVLPNGLTHIGQNAFSGYDITSITIPNTVTSIGIRAFQDCESLTGITIPNRVSSIGDEAFYGCSSLEYAFLSSSLSAIGARAFMVCTSLRVVDFPYGATAIGRGAFSGCSNLSSISIPNSVQTIGRSAFYCCVSLPGIVLPNSIRIVEPDTFSCCRKLTSIIIPKNVTEIRSTAFEECTALNQIIFEGNAPTIDSKAFKGVTAKVDYPMDNSTWTPDVMLNYGGELSWKMGDSYVPSSPSAPDKPNKIVNVVSGVHVYWDAVTNAAGYSLYRSETGVNGTYQWIANPTVPHFTDTATVSGKTYYYKVAAIGQTGYVSDKSEALGITFVSTPDIISRSNFAEGVQLGWEKSNGATGYAIYRKSYGDNDPWVRVATISGNNTFTWTDSEVKNNNGEVYRYTIRALAGSNMKTLSGCRNTGRTMVRLSSQVLKSVAKASATSAKATWTTSSRVTGYEVRFMVDGTVFKTFTVGNWKTGVKTFNGLPSGQTYTVQVRTYKKVDNVGSFYSDWSSPKSITLS